MAVGHIMVDGGRGVLGPELLTMCGGVGAGVAALCGSSCRVHLGYMLRVWGLICVRDADTRLQASNTD